MCHGISFLFALLSVLVTSQQQELLSDYNDKDDNNKPQLINDFRKEDSTDVPRILNKDQEEDAAAVLPFVLETTERQLTNYEVTELIEDVLDMNPTRGTIFTNFTISRPLNLAGVNKSDTAQTDVKDDGDEVLNSIFVPQDVEQSKSDGTVEPESEKGRSFFKHDDKETFIEHFHHRDSYYEDDDEEVTDDEDYDGNCEPKTDFGHDFHTVTRRLYDFLTARFNRRDVKHIHRVNCAPFFRTLHKKGSILVNRLHNAFLRHKLQNHEEYDDYY